MDFILLGMVDRVGSICRHLYCKGIQRKNGKGVCNLCHAYSKSFGFIWFSVFGGTGLHLELFDAVHLAEAVKEDTTTALFLMLEQLPLGTIVAFIATLLIMTFFITSADSATFVLGMLTSDGKLDPSTKVKLTWGIMQSSIAVVLLISGD